MRHAYRVRGMTAMRALRAVRAHTKRWGAKVRTMFTLEMTERRGEERETHLAGGARGVRFLYYAGHRGAGPVRTGTGPVLGLAFAARGEDCRPEGVFES
jgi:hypothetical protein